MEVKGSKVILGVAAGVVLIAAVIGATYLFFAPETAPCASGDAADNRLVNGEYQPRHETFETLHDAEAFICHSVPVLHDEAWAISEIAAERTLPLDNIIDGDGFAAVNLSYVDQSGDRNLQLDVTPFIFDETSLPSNTTRELGEIHDEAATIIRGGINPNFVTVLWSYRKLQLRAATSLDSDFTAEDLLALLNTVS